jgi:uncharacterized protein DUF4410
LFSSFAIVPPKRVRQSPQGLPRVHPHRRPDARFSSPERARCKDCKPGEPGAPPPRPACIVYVQDFKVEKESSTEQESLGGGRARAMIARLKGATEMQSSQVVDLMSSSLVSDLNRGGIKAVRLPAGQPLPKSGWLVRGVFTEVEQGSRALRAEVGFGAGATDLAVLVNVADLQKGKAKPFYRLETQAGSRKMPGGASMAIVTKNPYVAAAKFVMSRRDLPKNIRQSAQTIADQIISGARQP